MRIDIYTEESLNPNIEMVEKLSKKVLKVLGNDPEEIEIRFMHMDDAPETCQEEVDNGQSTDESESDTDKAIEEFIKFLETVANNEDSEPCAPVPEPEVKESLYSKLDSSASSRINLTAIENQNMYLIETMMEREVVHANALANIRKHIVTDLDNAFLTGWAQALCLNNGMLWTNISTNEKLELVEQAKILMKANGYA